MTLTEKLDAAIARVETVLDDEHADRTLALEDALGVLRNLRAEASAEVAQ